MESLSTNSHILITQADKGGAIVMQDKCNYIAECQHQLSNEIHYKKLSYDPTQELNNKILRILRTLRTAVHLEDITEEEDIYLFRDNPRISQLLHTTQDTQERQSGKTNSQ